MEKIKQKSFTYRSLTTKLIVKIDSVVTDENIELENRGLSRGKIESIFGHFTKFNFRKTDFSQNSIREKHILHKIQCEKNGLFTKFKRFIFFGGSCAQPFF